MHFYTLSIISSAVAPLTYASKERLDLGTIASVELRGKLKDAVVIAEVPKPSFECKEIVSTSEFCFTDEQIQTANFMASYYLCSLGEAYAVMQSDLRPVIASEAKQSKLDNLDRHGSKESRDDLSSSILLSPKQQEAYDFIDTHEISLLFGDTGSGKSEIYMSHFQKALDEGKRALFLLPEISLTPQMQTRLEKHFGECVAIYHSKLSKKARSSVLERVRSGEARVIAGARSALFLPLKDLGFIAVDEEHDDSYKSSSKPYYNARDMAIFVAKLHGAKVVLGSATPSLSSYAKFASFRLKGTHFESKKQTIYDANYDSISPLIAGEISATLASGKQAIIFLPTRANFKYLSCKSCGHNFECGFCSVGMSLHSKHNYLKCHYCNFTSAIPTKCEACGDGELTSSRLGTAEVLKELEAMFEGVSVAQFDRDAITTQKRLASTLESFNSGEISILVGTQMLSKGHDYHGVALAVVLGVDHMLYLADHRAKEKALSTALQVAGRSGRSGEAKVIVQSMHSDFFMAYESDYELFLKHQLELAKGLYPPFTKLARVLFAHKNATKASDAMSEMRSNLERFSDVEIVGSGKCAIEYIASKHRFEILLRSSSGSSLRKAIRASMVELAVVDVDPIEFN